MLNTLNDLLDKINDFVKLAQVDNRSKSQSFNVDETISPPLPSQSLKLDQKPKPPKQLQLEDNIDTLTNSLKYALQSKKQIEILKHKLEQTIKQLGGDNPYLDSVVMEKIEKATNLLKQIS